MPLQRLNHTMKNILRYNFVLMIFAFSCNSWQHHPDRPDIIVSTDIGGSDPDDYQSLVHLLIYANRFSIKGLISSPPHAGRKQHIEEVVHAYGKDYVKLLKHSPNFPSPQYLLQVTKQGAENIQLTSVPNELSEGAEWIIKKANENIQRPLYILAWGSMTDIAQAIHHSPGIKKNIRIYSIGSWNTAQDQNARDYLYREHRDIWWIENNSTFRGMYLGGYQDNHYGNKSFVETCVKDYGALGKLFYEKKQEIKMGDTPSILYFLHGDINIPTDESWGGSFVKDPHRSSYWTDNPADSLLENDKAGAKTVSKFRKEFLDDWCARMRWLARL